jgi:hypothetical protein
LGIGVNGSIGADEFVAVTVGWAGLVAELLGAVVGLTFGVVVFFGFWGLGVPEVGCPLVSPPIGLKGICELLISGGKSDGGTRTCCLETETFPVGLGSVRDIGSWPICGGVAFGVMVGLTPVGLVGTLLGAGVVVAVGLTPVLLPIAFKSAGTGVDSSGLGAMVGVGFAVGFVVAVGFGNCCPELVAIAVGNVAIPILRGSWGVFPGAWVLTVGGTTGWDCQGVGESVFAGSGDWLLLPDLTGLLIQGCLACWQHLWENYHGNQVVMRVYPHQELRRSPTESQTQNMNESVEF